MKVNSVGSSVHIHQERVSRKESGFVERIKTSASSALSFGVECLSRPSFHHHNIFKKLVKGAEKLTKVAVRIGEFLRLLKGH